MNERIKNRENERTTGALRTRRNLVPCARTFRDVVPPAQRRHERHRQAAERACNGKTQSRRHYFSGMRVNPVHSSIYKWPTVSVPVAKLPQFCIQGCLAANNLTEGPNDFALSPVPQSLSSLYGVVLYSSRACFTLGGDQTLDLPVAPSVRSPTLTCSADVRSATPERGEQASEEEQQEAEEGALSVLPVGHAPAQRSEQHAVQDARQCLQRTPEYGQDEIAFGEGDSCTEKAKQNHVNQSLEFRILLIF